MNSAFWKNKRVLITGAGGFVGSQFYDELADIAEKVIGISLRSNSSRNSYVIVNLLEKDSLLKLCSEENVNTIIHCAALDGNAEFKANNSARIMEENILMVTNVLNASKNSEVRDVVLMSSAEIYAPLVGSPIKEDDDYRKNFHHGGNGYVLSKIFSEIMGNMYSKQFGINIYFPRPTNIYGPGDRFEVEANRVIPSMIRKVLSHEKIEIWGDGNQIRSFVYIKDVVKMVLTMVEMKKYQTLNIASDDSISILELAKLISKISNTDLNLELLMDRPTGIMKRILDDSKVRSILDYKPRKLEDGLAETINWYKQNYL